MREEVAPPAEPTLEDDSPWLGYFTEASWVWYPEGDPAQAAPAGMRYFRKQVNLPVDRRIARVPAIGIWGWY